jgi:type IV pilus assembly protein PilB
VHAAMTGHLVFSTLHTNSAAKTVSRVLEMGAKNYMVSSTVIGILAQRLIRRNCKGCVAPYQATEDEKIILGLDPLEPLTLQKGVGCEKCNHSGYAGRVGLYEIMNVERNIQEAIDRGASVIEIQDLAISNGMYTLAMDGKRKILDGQTTVDEVTRVLGLDLSV